MARLWRPAGASFRGDAAAKRHVFQEAATITDIKARFLSARLLDDDQNFIVALTSIKGR